MRHLITATCILCMAGTTTAQWSDDSSVNMLVPDGGSSPAVTHSAPDGNGGCWITWYDASNGYDVLLQHINADGIAQFDQPILVGDQSLSWVQDFELVADALGRAVVAWPGETKIEVACVNLDGSIAWTNEFGANGAFLGQAQLAPLPAGFIALAWAEDDRSVIQRITMTGASYGSAVVLDIGGTLIPSDLKSTGNGTFIASFVHYEAFSGPKRLKAQKYSSNMAGIWGLNPIDVFTSGSLQFGNYPEFIADTNGGGVFCWYETSPLMTRLQWIDADGNRLMGTNGMTTTTETSMVHVNPHACIDPTSGDATVFWVRQNSSQGSSGIQANRISSDGTRVWGATGIQIAPVSSGTSLLDLHAVQVGALATGSWIKSPTLGTEQVQAAAARDDGSLAWGITPVVASNAASDKTDMTSCLAGQMLVTCWVDDRAGADGLYAQNINENGTLGIVEPCLGDMNEDGQVGVDDLLLVIGAWGNPYTVDDLLIVIGAWGYCP
ncbi:MAG: hypothetical protein MK095_08225 [Phycisphaerales bacterium]|nr:hypothetical protein [Phycisphaerales bacterium]